MQARDTSEKAAAIQDQLHDRLGPEGRLRLAMEMSELAHEFAIAGIRSRHPELPEAALMRELARILFGK